MLGRRGVRGLPWFPDRLACGCRPQGRLVDAGAPGLPEANARLAALCWRNRSNPCTAGGGPSTTTVARWCAGILPAAHGPVGVPAGALCSPAGRLGPLPPAAVAGRLPAGGRGLLLVGAGPGPRQPHGLARGGGAARGRAPAAAEGCGGPGLAPRGCRCGPARRCPGLHGLCFRPLLWRRGCRRASAADLLPACPGRRLQASAAPAGQARGASGVGSLFRPSPLSAGPRAGLTLRRAARGL
mmetsp:Transcript_55976/g.173412  ORF Transcript_55976/g.173412 Transcript_55976/m.173412 type:complete len:241 (-) Transcript_55976:1684-2406(-)